MTDDRLAALSARRATRDKHPARSARVLVTGVSMSALASLVSAFTVQAAMNTPAPSDDAIDAQTSSDPTSAVPINPPTLPAPAEPVRQIVEIDIAQPPTPVATAAPQQPASNASQSSALGPLGSIRFSGGGGSSGGSGGGGLGGGGSSGGSGGSR